ncbi:MAG: hydantoinase/oxoprolinase family protein [Minwuiales bacterium]|nr:hydantoinase/oxoprolinase family protein [Minwuiales bacterium]
MSCRLGIEVGRTFTNLLLFNERDGAVRLLKTPTTADDQAAAVLMGIERLIADAGVAPGDITDVRYGTTVPDDILVERRGARVGLLVTRNFEQVLHLARGEVRSPQPLARPTPPVDLEFTRGVPERTNARGEVVSPLDEAAARSAAQELVELGVDAIAVSLLHAYANAAHERQLRDIVHEIDEDMPVYLSSETRRECGEYERTLVTAVNAYIGPGIGRHLADFGRRLGELGGTAQISVMRADGGATNADQLANAATTAVASGPAGGVVAAAQAAHQAGLSDAFAVDMGGTSTNLSLIRDGEAPIGRQAMVDAYSVRVAAMDVRSVDVSGGSLAHVPMTGALRVGPESAGAVPGPACYGRGGNRATVTDANLMLGRLPAALLGGGMMLDMRAAEEAIGRVARELDVEPHRAAQGIVDVANERIAGALRRVAARNANEPKNLALIAFGGAGPLHANAMAALIGSFPVVVPPNAGVLAAQGHVQADSRNEFVQAVIRQLAELSDGRVGEILTKLGRYARDGLTAEGIDGDRQELTFEADLRYFGWDRELSLPLSLETLSGRGVQDMAERFAVQHERQYGFRLDQPVELVNLRAIGSAPTGAAVERHSHDGGGDQTAAVVEERRAHFDGQPVNTHVYDRALLRPGHVLRGPAIVVQADTTTVVHPGHSAHVDAHLNILISPEGA